MTPPGNCRVPSSWTRRGQVRDTERLGPECRVRQAEESEIFCFFFSELLSMEVVWPDGLITSQNQGGKWSMFPPVRGK